MTDATFLEGEARVQEKRAIRAEARAALFRERLSGLLSLIERGYAAHTPEMVTARAGATKALFENPAMAP